ncbi:MAG TPA: peptidoglycan DD-metalloendopeptidase family protein [Patescibacteria group bacterium]|nr:peptidoglycan DD-metalloendopeptidase family protein [Patescibacteria group bacterium]
MAVLCLASPAHAKRDIDAELAKKQQEKAALEKQSQEITAELGGLKTKLVGMAAQLRETEDKLSDTAKKLKDLQARKDATVKILYKDHDALGGLVSAAGKFQRTPKPQLLLLGDPLDSARASMVMKDMIPALQEHATDLRAQLDEMTRIENQIDDKLDDQKAALKKLTRQQDDMAGLVKKRQSVYEKTEAQRAQQEKELAALAKEAKTLAELERKLAAKSRAEEKASGKAKKSSSVARNAPLPSGLKQPVAGSVYTGFGETDDLGAKSEGITFAARGGSSVMTPMAGTVKFAGPFQKYKQILIIEHAGGYHSLIAGLGRIDTVVGATLAAGEPVGSAEKSDSKIYYELRRGGEPVNPRQSMVAQRKQDKS